MNCDGIQVSFFFNINLDPSIYYKFYIGYSSALTDPVYSVALFIAILNTWHSHQNIRGWLAFSSSTRWPMKKVLHGKRYELCKIHRLLMAINRCLGEQWIGSSHSTIDRLRSTIDRAYQLRPPIGLQKEQHLSESRDRDLQVKALVHGDLWYYRPTRTMHVWHTYWHSVTRTHIYYNL